MGSHDRYAFGDFVLEKSQQRLSTRSGAAIALTPRLFSALVLFVERAGELLDKELLIDSLWPGLVVEDNNLSQVVFGLRKALGDDGTHFIQTVPRRGFRFIAKVEALADEVPHAREALQAAAKPSLPRRRQWLAAAGAAALGVAGVAAWTLAASPARRRAAIVSPGPPDVEDGGTRNAEAAELYIAAVRLGQGRDRHSIDRAIRLLEQAVAIDPQFAAAWSRLALTHRRKLWNGDAAPREVFPEAERANDRALALAPELPQALSAQGFKQLLFDYDRERAEATFRRAIRSSASEDTAHIGLGMVLLSGDRVEEGIAHVQTARELAPYSPSNICWEARVLLMRGHVAQARRRVEQALDFAPQFWVAQSVLAGVQYAEGRPQEGLASLRKAVELAPRTSQPKAALAFRLMQAGRREEAEAIRAELLAASNERYVPPTALASAHVALGDRQGAMRWLEQAFDARDERLVFIKDDRHWHDLRGERAFTALLRRLRLDGLGRGLAVG